MFKPELTTIIELDTDMVITNNNVLAAITDGTNVFQFALGVGKRIAWKLKAIVSLGATGGFKFLAHNSQAASIYNAAWTMIDGVTPATYNAAQLAEANFANAAAHAVDLQLEAWGVVVNGATADVFTLEAAQNSADAASMTIRKGAILEVIQY